MEAQDTLDQKAALRREAAAKRRLAFAADPAAGNALDRELRAAISVPVGSLVSGYWPMSEEIDIRPTLRRLHEDGCVVGLPVVVGRDKPLLFRVWRPGIELVLSRFNVEIPPDNCPEMTPSVLLVPLLAFDRDGYRLGYGGGFYDRTLARLRDAGGPILSIGVAYSAQEVARVPRGPYDQPLDWIATESWARPIAARANRE